MSWESGALTVDGMRIAYHRTGGAGPVVVLLHGVTDDGLCWTRVARDLEGEFDVLMPDVRGHGESGRLTDGLTVDRLAADVAGLLDGLGIGSALVLGHSMGAITALALAADRPDLVRGIVLEDPPLEGSAPPPEVIHAILAENATWPTLSEAERHARGAAQNPEWDRSETDPWADSKARTDPAVARSLGAFVAYDWRAALARVRCPGLLVTGDQGLQALVSPATAQEALDGWPGGRVVHVPGAGHSIHRDRWDEAMPPIRAFLRRPGD